MTVSRLAGYFVGIVVLANLAFGFVSAYSPSQSSVQASEYDRTYAGRTFELGETGSLFVVSHVICYEVDMCRAYGIFPTGETQRVSLHLLRPYTRPQDRG